MGFDVAVVGDRDAALHAIGDFFGIVFEATQRSDFALEDDHVVAQQADFGVALDQAIDYAAARDRSHFRDAEGFEHLGAALVGFFDRRLEQAAHGALDLVLQFVNDRVQADVDFFLLGELLRLALRTHIEADDDGIRRRGQQYVGFGDGTHARTQQLEANFVVRQLGEQIAEHFDRALHIAFENDVEFFGARGLDLFGQTFERYARTLGQRGFTGLLFAVFGNAAGFVAIGDHDELISGLRPAFHAQDFDWC